MKTKIVTALISLASAAGVNARGLYYVPNDTEESLPLSWNVGVTAQYDDNTSPGGFTDGDETFSLNPYIGLSVAKVTPQTTVDVYATLGVVYYFEEPDGTSDDIFSQSRVGMNLAHRFSDRLRLVSKAFVSYEIEPDFAYGFATSRQLGETLYYQTDNALGYRWTDRFATYTGFQLQGTQFEDSPNADRFLWTLYNQFRYQLSPQTVLTSDYRYQRVQGGQAASDSSNHFFLVGLEHRFNPSTILVASAGVQLRDVDFRGGSSSSNPFVELALNTRVNQQFSLRSFARFSSEDFDTVLGFPPIEFQDRLTLRFGVTGDYQLSESVSFFGGVNLVSTSFEDGVALTPPFGSVGDLEEVVYNAFLGATVRVTDSIYASASYNYITSDSDLGNRDFDRNRFSLGVNSEF